jgi:hypothetical protein
MNLDRMDVCSLMFFLGWIQVIWAAIQIGVTKSATVRKHFGYYFLGVLSYFILLILLAMLIAIAPKSHILFEIHFFGSAFGLAIYHALHRWNEHLDWLPRPKRSHSRRKNSRRITFNTF